MWLVVVNELRVCDATPIIIIRVKRTCIFSVATYESVTISQSQEKKIMTFKFISYRKILRTPWFKRVKNTELYKIRT